MKSFFIWVLGAFGCHIAEKIFSFRVNGLPLKDFPVSAADFEKYVRSHVIGSTSREAAVIILGKEHDVFSSLSTPEKLRKAMAGGQEVTINDIIAPLVG